VRAVTGPPIGDHRGVVVAGGHADDDRLMGRQEDTVDLYPMRRVRHAVTGQRWVDDEQFIEDVAR
jgi:hypothetical protein